MRPDLSTLTPRFLTGLCHGSCVDLGCLRFFWLHDAEIRHLWGPDHLLQHSLVLVSLEFNFFLCDCVFGVVVLMNGADQTLLWCWKDKNRFASIRLGTPFTVWASCSNLFTKNSKWKKTSNLVNSILFGEERNIYQTKVKFVHHPCYGEQTDYCH